MPEYTPNGHESAVIDYIALHPHTSIDTVIDEIGMNLNDAFGALDELKKQGILIPDEKMEIIASTTGLGLTQRRTYTVNLNHPNMKRQ